MAAPPDTRDRLLYQLKTKGPRTALQLADKLSITPTAVRQHLDNLAEEGLVESANLASGTVGRPARTWQLAEAAAERFPVGYADLAVEMIAAVRETFGPEGLERLVEQRTQSQLEAYRSRIPQSAPLARKVAALAKVRREEGYLAEWKRERDGSLTLIENHCPICAAAEICQGLCGGEITLFRDILGPGARVERTEHLLDGSRRCAYRIESVPA